MASRLQQRMKSGAACRWQGFPLGVAAKQCGESVGESGHRNTREGRKKKKDRQREKKRDSYGHSPRSLCVAGVTNVGHGDDETRAARERKTSQLAYHNKRCWLERVRWGCRAQGPSYRRVSELLNSLCSHGLGMYQLITPAECEQTGCASSPKGPAFLLGERGNARAGISRRACACLTAAKTDGWTDGRTGSLGSSGVERHDKAGPGF